MILLDKEEERKVSITTQSTQDLLKHLNDSLYFLEASSQAFDEGYLSEAKRLATTIRVLLHDTRTSHSILGQLGVKSNLDYINSAPPLDPTPILSETGFIGIRRINNSTTFYAPLGDHPPFEDLIPYKKFDEWWNEGIIRDNTGQVFSRSKLILEVVNKDGGAHVDPNLNLAYAELSRNNSMDWVVSDGENLIPLKDFELYCIRQIAYELYSSLKQAGY